MTELYEKIDVDDRVQANNIFNEIKICDPAVGSGHFLVSALNELIAIKSELRILLDRAGKRLKEYRVFVESDELIATDEDGDIVEYYPKSAESQRVQETLFHEKQLLIENCLFGVDINPNSVKICRLRLWIELLKNAYYNGEQQLETLPNIDINIKVGNSLVGRFALNANLAKALKKAKHGVLDYRKAVSAYRNAKSKDEKAAMEQIIADIKSHFREDITANDPLVRNFRKAAELLDTLLGQTMLFKQSEEEEERYRVEVESLTATVDRLRVKIRTIEESEIFASAFEWRFEFPEALDEKGNFIGFDLIIGNPPYGVKSSLVDRKHLLKSIGKVPDYEVYYWFIERAHQLLRTNGRMTFLIPNSILFNVNAQDYRQNILKRWTIDEMLDCTAFPIFADATVRNVIMSACKLKTSEFGYRETAGADTFATLVARPRVQTNDDLLLGNNRNWGLVFKTSPEVLDIIHKLREGSRAVSTVFPEISQGLIAYDAHRGQDALTIKNRIFHSNEKIDGSYKP